MFGWLAANAGTIVVLLIVLLCVSLAAMQLIRDKKKGKTSCGCGCANCAMHGACHKCK